MEETFVLVLLVALASIVVVPFLGGRIAHAADTRQRLLSIGALVLWVALAVAVVGAAG